MPQEQQQFTHTESEQDALASDRKRLLHSASSDVTTEYASESTSKVAKIDAVHIKFLIPASVAGGVIGRGGEFIADVQRRTQTRMKMSRTSDMFPGTQERVCLVTGDIPNVMQVYDYITDKIKGRFVPSDNEDTERCNQFQFVVPNTTAGMLIGKSGSQIRSIKEVTGANINVSPRNDEVGERIGVIYSVDDCVRRKAFELILQKIAEDPLHSSYPTIVYEKLSSPATQLDSYTSGFGTPASVPLSNPQQMQIRQLQYQLQPNGPNSSDNNMPSNSCNPLMQSGLFNLSQIINNAGGVNTLTADYLKSTSSPAGLGTNAALNRSNTSSSFNPIANIMFPPGNSHQSSASSSNSTATTTSAAAAAALANIESAMSKSNIILDPNDRTESNSGDAMTMQLPDQYAGSIIGAGGKGITLLQQRSGAHIHVSSRGHFVPGTSNRLVTITGTPDACSQAQALISDAIFQEEQRRRK